MITLKLCTPCCARKTGWFVPGFQGGLLIAEPFAVVSPLHGRRGLEGDAALPRCDPLRPLAPYAMRCAVVCELLPNDTGCAVRCGATNTSTQTAGPGTRTVLRSLLQQTVASALWLLLLYTTTSPGVPCNLQMLQCMGSCSSCNKAARPDVNGAQHLRL